MSARDPKLQNRLDLTEETVVSAVHTCEAARPVASRIFARLRNQTGSRNNAAPESLPVRGAFHTALRLAEQGPPPIPRLASALMELAPDLMWRRRKGAETESRNFFDGHANATVVGKDGMELRDDVMVGISLMAPHVRYPNHQHPPEEIYISLAGGAWWKEGGSWHEPGSGGLVYNEPKVLHAMATDDKPLLAVWCLWLG